MKWTPTRSRTSKTVPIPDVLMEPSPTYLCALETDVDVQVDNGHTVPYPASFEGNVNMQQDNGHTAPSALATTVFPAPVNHQSQVSSVPIITEPNTETSAWACKDGYRGAFKPFVDSWQIPRHHVPPMQCVSSAQMCSEPLMNTGSTQAGEPLTDLCPHLFSDEADGAGGADGAGAIEMIESHCGYDLYGDLSYYAYPLLGA